jgi:hypothetical protein
MRSGSPRCGDAIEAVISRAELGAAVATVNEIVLPGTKAGADDWRAELAGRFTTVSGFVKLLTGVIEFGVNAEGEPGLGQDVLLQRRTDVTPDAPESLRSLGARLAFAARGQARGDWWPAGW